MGAPTLPSVLGNIRGGTVARDLQRMVRGPGPVYQQIAMTHGLAVGTTTGLSGQSITGSTSGETSATYRTAFKTPRNHAAENFVFEFINASTKFDDLGEYPNVTTITVKHVLEYPLNTLANIYYNNGTVQSLAIPGGHVVRTDPVHGFQVPADTFGYIRTYVSVGSGGWPIYQGGLTGFNETYLTGVDSTSGSGITNTFGYMFAPTRILGTLKALIPNVLLAGDSITYGLGDSNGSRAEVGWGQRALSNIYPAHKIAKSSGSVTHMVNSWNLNRRRWYMAKNGGPEFCGYTHVVCLYGTNDLTASRTSTQVIADLTTLYQIFKDMGLIVIAVTIPPHTTSSGGQWVSDNDQTPANSTFNTTHRAAINAFILAQPTNVDFIYDLNALVTSGGKADVWLNDGTTNKKYTNDGLHPNTAGNVLIAADFATHIASWIY